MDLDVKENFRPKSVNIKEREKGLVLLTDSKNLWI